MHNTLFKETKSILCLNGELPGRSFFENKQYTITRSAKKLIIATDGAADQLLSIGIKPDTIIGDFDSIKYSKPHYMNINMIYLPDQNQSDFEKALHYLAQQNLLPTLVCGISGGFLDHILQNINLLVKNNCVLYTPSIIGCVLNKGIYSYANLQLNTKLSLFGIPNAIVTTSGLKWNLERATLEFPGNTSCFNRTVNHEIAIQVFDGKVLMLAYTVQ